MRKPADKALLAKAQQGDMDAFADLFESLRQAVHAVAYRLVGPSDADDVVMETFLRAWQSLPKFGGRASLKTWLYRIAHNCAIDHTRSRGYEAAHTVSDSEVGQELMAGVPDATQAGPDEVVERREIMEKVRASLGKLQEAHRTALLLRYADGLEYSEIAEATGVSIGTVMSRLFYGKRKLRELVEEELRE